MIRRVITGIAAGIVALLAAWVGPYWWLGLVVLLLAVAASEWAKLADASTPLLVLTHLAAVALIILDQWFLLPLLLLVPAVPLLVYQDPSRGQDAVWSAAGILWLAFPAALIFFVRQEYGFVALIVLMAGTILQDSLAYYSGYLFGGDRPFTPNLSPNKTWAGFFGGLTGMMAALVVGGVWMGWPWFVFVPAALVLGVVGQAGDLSMSALKRLMDVDDTGSIFPGHGGILDRTDGLIFNVVIFYPLCRYVDLLNLQTVVDWSILSGLPT